MRYLVLSDLHANWEALQAALAAAESRYDRIVCCGDLVGYGADPNRVVDWARSHCGAIVRGNHDKAAAGQDDLGWFNANARRAAEWTAARLTPSNLDWVRNLPQGPLEVDGFDLIHGSPVDEDEYLTTAYEAAAAMPYAARALSFFGHTHLQGGFVWKQGKALPIARPSPFSDRRTLEIETGAAYLINPGSVGQPRDGDPRAAFAIYDSDAQMISYRRTEYDVAAAQEKIRAAGLPPMLAERLAAGR